MTTLLPPINSPGAQGAWQLRRRVVPTEGVRLCSAERLENIQGNPPKGRGANKRGIYKQLRGKAGVYLFINKTTGDYYVGSSINLSKRMTSGGSPGGARYFLLAGGGAPPYIERNTFHNLRPCPSPFG